MAQFKTLQFPNTARGQADKIRALEDHTSQGWRVVSETIIPGKFDAQKAACLWVACGPICGLLAGHKEDIIQLTLQRSDEASNVTQVSSALTGSTVSYDRSRWNALLQFDKEVFAACEEVHSLGQKWVDELASSYMTLNDKAYLPTIVQNIKSKAAAEQEEKNRQIAEEEARRKADFARAEERRQADAAAKAQRQKEREENAVFLGRSQNELIAYGFFFLLLIGIAVAYFAMNKSAPAAAPAPAETTLQSPTPLPQTAVEPSFDCSKVQSAVLKLVCSTPELAQLDRQLSNAYAGALDKSSSPQTLRSEERAWIQQRNNSNADVDTVRQIYQARLDALNAVSSEPKPSPSPTTTDGTGGSSSASPSDGATSSPPQDPTTPPDGSSAIAPAASQSTAKAQGHWYYCDVTRAYYPTVRTCSIPWRAVDPISKSSPTSSGGPSQ